MWVRRKRRSVQANRRVLLQRGGKEWDVGGPDEEVVGGAGRKAKDKGTSGNVLSTL